jgi:hypothetical protein
MRASIAAGRREAGGPRKVLRLGVLRKCKVDGGMDGQQLRQSGNLNHGVSLLREAGQGEALASAPAVHKELDQGADSGGVEKGDAAHIKNEMCRRFGTKDLDEIVNGFEAQFAIELDHKAVGIRSRESLQVKFYGLHGQRN